MASEAGCSRRATWPVRVGRVTIGGDAPVAVQSMTTTPTSDARATARQVEALARAGCDLVRVTVPSRRDADALPEIRRRLRDAGVDVPLVADIHFSPRLALDVVEHVDKVRVNPGNFADRKSVSGAPYDDSRFDEDAARAEELFAPLVERALERGVALRIGVNHGSLSDRMVHRYGDSPEGMVASALEYVRFAVSRGHRGIVVSMKASNTQVMVAAYRLLARRLDEAGLPLPLHLGVTEAGGGDEGRLKSAVGIATLLAEGLGDTVRVSLTEDPLAEVPVAQALVRLFARPAAPPARPGPPASRRSPAGGRATAAVTAGGLVFGGSEPPRVEVVLGARDEPGLRAALAATPAVELIDVEAGVGEGEPAARLLRAIGRDRGVARGLTLGPAARDALVAGDRGLRAALLEADRLALRAGAGESEALLREPLWRELPLLLLLDPAEPGPGGTADRIAHFARVLAGARPALAAGLWPDGAGEDWTAWQRRLEAALARAGARTPLVLWCDPPPGEDPRIGTGGRLGALLLDGIGAAVRARGAGAGASGTVRLLHGVLQAARRRLEQAEYIACPSCGRTLFELEATTARVRALTSHLKLKIAVMGCIVNGPGEMADADYGYVGWGPGKVALFAGRDLVEKDVPAGEAPDRLVALIRRRGDWIEPPARSA